MISLNISVAADCSQPKASCICGGGRIRCKNGLLCPLNAGPEKTVQGELDAGLEPVGEEPFGQFPRFAGTMGRAEKDLLGRTWRALSQEMLCPEIIRTALHHELDFVPGSEMAKVIEVHSITHAAVRALHVQDANGSFGEGSNVQASVGFHQDGVALPDQTIDECGAFILQEGFTSGHFHEAGVIGRHGREDILHRQILPFLIGVPGVTVRAPKVTPRQPDKEAGQSGERGFPLDTEESFVYHQSHSSIPVPIRLVWAPNLPLPGKVTQSRMR